MPIKKIIPDRPDVTIDSLKQISDQNFKDAISFLNHTREWADSNNQKISAKPKVSNLKDIILNPNLSEIPTEDINLNETISEQKIHGLHDDQSQIKNYIKALEEEKRKKLGESIFKTKKEKYDIRSKYLNVFRVDSLDDSQNTFINQLKHKKVKCALIITDTFYTRDQDFYKKILDLLRDNGISYAEYTNIQPDLSKKLIFRIAEFAMSHEVNSIIAIGSQSTVDVSKILLTKLMKPNIINLHKTRIFKKGSSGSSTEYSVFSIPTIVVPDDKVNSRSVIENRIFDSKFSFFGNILCLKNEIDDADGVFYCAEMFDILSSDKIKQILNETFFRSIFNYFDLVSSVGLKEHIITNIKSLQRMMAEFRVSGTLSEADKHNLLRIIAGNMDGRSVVDVTEFWLWHKLECSLSHLVNSRKSDGLALFLPTFIEVMSEHSVEFNKLALDLASKLYEAYSIEGFIYKLILHIKDQGLPLSLIDVPQVKRVDYKFLSMLLRKAYIGKYAIRLHKAMIKNLTILS